MPEPFPCLPFALPYQNAFVLTVRCSSLMLYFMFLFYSELVIKLNTIMPQNLLVYTTLIVQRCSQNVRLMHAFLPGYHESVEKMTALFRPALCELYWYSSFSRTAVSFYAKYTHI
jgi:hypothetical protein